MKKTTKLIIMMFLFLMSPLLANADCESDFKAVEKKYKVTYKYNASTDDFSIILVSPNFERYGFHFHTKAEIETAEKSVTADKVLTVTIKNYKSTEYKYSLEARYDGCNGVVIREGTLKLAKVNNPYSTDSRCAGNEDFVLCQKDYDKEINETIFKSRLETYLKEKEGNDTQTTNNNTNTTNNNTETKNDTNQGNFFEKITNYIQENMVTVIIIVIFVILLTITAIVTIKKEIKSRRLE